jgi:glycosyltransferase involved in cell wall biosynthesis
MSADQMPVDYLFKHNCPHIPVSYNFIVKGNVPAVTSAVDSVYGALFTPECDDECILVDTGSSDEEFVEMLKLTEMFPNLTVIDRRDLSVDYEPLCKEYLDASLYETFKAHGGSGTGILSFAEARNVALDHSKNDIVFWMDSDDVLGEDTPGNLRKAVDRIFGESEMQQIFMDYEYEFGPDGTCTTTLRRERFFMKDKFRWKGNCHETAIPVAKMGPVGFFEPVAARIIHTENRKPHEISDIRNYLILRKEFEESRRTHSVDPRTIFYLGNSARGLQRFREALTYYDFFDFRSGSVDDRFAARYYRAGIYMDPKVKRPFDALDEYLECVKIKPFDPRGYYGVSRAYTTLARFKEAIMWYHMGQAQEIPKDQIFSHDPTHIHYHPHVIAAHAFKELGHHEDALRAILKAVEFRPNLAEAQDLAKRFQMNLEGERITQAIGKVMQHTRYQGPDAIRVGKQISEELSSVPPGLEKRGIASKEAPEGREDKPSISILCVGIGEPWGPFSRKSGIGGSEKMVLMMADALQSTGLVNVTVYNDIPASFRGVAENGVCWRHYAEFDQRRKRDVVVFWRNPNGPLTFPCVAKKRIIWNHDVQNPSRYSEDALALTDFVQFQSEYHTQPVLDTVPEEKLWVARNAIEVDKTKDAPPRNPKRVVYCSSPDRGLLTAAKVFQRAKAIDPELEFVVTYGITPWARKMFAKQNHGFIPDLGRDGSFDEYERTLHRALDACDAMVLNRVGFEEMRGLMLSSGVWLYPTRFPEISCMSAMEAQSAGMVVCATRYGALAETISPTAFPALPELEEYGDIPEAWYDEAAKMLVAATKVPTTAAMRRMQAKEANDRFNVESLAQEWLQKLGLLGGSADSPEAQVPRAAAEPLSKE